MRRKDREVTDPHRLTEIIRACDCCRLGIRDGEGAYVVPLNFGYRAEGKGVFYFHCAKEGYKLTLLEQAPNVGFEMDTHHELRRGPKGCDFTFLYSSVMGRGVVRTVTALAEKRKRWPAAGPVWRGRGHDNRRGGGRRDRASAGRERDDRQGTPVKQRMETASAFHARRPFGPVVLSSCRCTRSAGARWRRAAGGGSSPPAWEGGPASCSAGKSG